MMINGLKILSLIPARGGSKGIKKKNIIDLYGKPLISYSIEPAKKSKYIDSVIVTTDSEEIKDISIKFGAEVPFLRPDYLASDTARTIDAVIHAITYLKKVERNYDILILLQPTQPLRTTEDIDQALELFIQHGMKSVVSVSLIKDHPILTRTINSNGELVNLINRSSTIRRQDMPAYYKINGCIYINSVNEINENTSFNDNRVPFIMNLEHSIDIDDYRDLILAEYYLSKREGKG